MSETVDRLSTRLKLFWGSGALGVALLMNAVSFLILVYLVSVLKLDPALAGSIVFVSKIIDAISDPLMGIISDRSKFSSGRRRPFLFLGSFVSAIAFGLIFNIPSFDNQTATSIYALGCLVLYTLGYTIFNVPYMAMSAEMTDGYEERTSLHGFRVAFISIGSTIAASGAPFVLQVLGQTAETYSLIGITFGALIFASLITCYLGTKGARTIEYVQSGYPVMRQLSLLFENKHFVALIIVKTFQLIGVASVVSVTLFFFSQYVGLDLRLLTVFGLTNTVVTFIAIPLLTKFASRVGKRNAYFCSAGLTVLYHLSWALVEPNPETSEFLPGFFLRAVVAGIILPGNVMFAMSMLTDTIDYDARRTGMRREGVYASMYSFTEKFSAALGPFLVGWVLAIAGYDKSLGPDALQSGNALFGILFGQAYLPAIMTAFSMVALLMYRLDKRKLENTGPVPT